MSFKSGHAQPGHVTGRGINTGSFLLHWQAVTGVCFLCCWSQREEAEMKVRIGKERVRCKNVNLSILITTMVIISDTAKIKYATCLEGPIYPTAPGLLSDKLINHNNDEIHTQNDCLGLDSSFSHHSDMERAERNLGE